MAFVNVILSGGVGSRLWPLSRKSRPKQYMPLFDGRSLFQMVVQRNKNLVNKIVVVNNIDHHQITVDNLSAFKDINTTSILETVPRNTAASIAFAAFALDAEDVMLVTPSDHIINGDTAYSKAIVQAKELAEKGYIVIFGARPTRPETGYGYIEFDNIHKVLSFKEKPTKDKAEEYVSKGNYLWNCGMFCFKASTYLKALKEYSYEVYDTAKKAWDANEKGVVSAELSEKIPALSVDYAVMEHASDIQVIPIEFEWSDLGSFEALWDYLDKQNEEKEQDKQTNLVLGTDKHVEFIGLENIILVASDDAILVMPKSMSQDVKKVYERLEIEKPELLK